MKEATRMATIEEVRELVHETPAVVFDLAVYQLLMEHFGEFRHRLELAAQTIQIERWEREVNALRTQLERARKLNPDGVDVEAQARTLKATIDILADKLDEQTNGVRGA